MPRPKGWSTAKLEKRDAMVKRLMKQGKSESAAYAIATAALKRGK